MSERSGEYAITEETAIDLDPSEPETIEIAAIEDVDEALRAWRVFVSVLENQAKTNEIDKGRLEAISVCEQFRERLLEILVENNLGTSRVALGFRLIGMTSHAALLLDRKDDQKLKESLIDWRIA